VQAYHFQNHCSLSSVGNYQFRKRVLILEIDKALARKQEVARNRYPHTVTHIDVVEGAGREIKVIRIHASGDGGIHYISTSIQIVWGTQSTRTYNMKSSV